MATAVDDEQDDLAIPEPMMPGTAESLLDQVVAERDRVAENQTEDFELPNNGGILWATYRLLPWRRVKEYAQSAASSKSPTIELQIAAEMIAEATVEVWLRGPDGRRVPWPGNAEGLRFDPQLLDFLRVDPLPAQAKPRDYVRVVLAPPAKSGEPRELAVTAHHQELVRWMEGAHAAVNRDYAEG